MKLGALLSGGKDSLLATCHAAYMQHTIECILHLETSKEVDSFLIQSVGSNYVKAIAKAMAVPYIGQPTSGIATEKDLYISEIKEDDETNDLYTLIKNAKAKFNLEGIISGAIESDYQRLRIEFICLKLGLTSFAPLWKSKSETLFKELSIVDSSIVKVSSMGLDKTHIGKNVVAIKEELMTLHSKYQSHPLGEGGEFETFTTYCPLFKQQLELDYEVIDEGQSCFAKINNCSLVPITSVKSLDVLRETRDFYSKENTYKVAIKEPSSSVILNEFNPSFNSYGPYSTVNNFFIYHKSEFNADAQYGLEQLKSFLKENKVQVEDLLIVHVYIQNMGLFGQFNALYGKLFTIKPPTRACVQATLPKNVLAKIDIILTKNPNKQVMHVASVSHKYPANIGPYSQCQKPLFESAISFIAGQVGFVPIKLAYPGCSDAKEATLMQNKYSTAHVVSICEEMKLYPASGVCFVRDSQLSQQVISTFTKEFSYIPAFTVQVERLPKDGEVEWLCLGTEKQQNFTKVDLKQAVEYKSEQIRIVLGHGDCKQHLKQKMTNLFVKNVDWETMKGVTAFIVPVNEITMDKTYDYAFVEALVN